MSRVEQYVALQHGQTKEVKAARHVMSYFVCCLLHGLTEKEAIYVGGGGVADHMQVWGVGCPLGMC